MARISMFGIALLSSFTGAAGAHAQDTRFEGMAVSVVTADRRCFENMLPVSGVLIAKNEIDVRPEKDGMLIGEVLVEPGDSVVANQVLARLVTPPGAPPQTVPVQSPAAGVAIAVSAPIGSYASPTAPDPMFKIIVDGELELRAQILVSKMALVRRGLPVTLNIIGFDPMNGAVTDTELTVDPVTQLGYVRISVPADTRLRPGAYVRAQIDAGEQCAVTVPLSAVLYGKEGAVVQVVTDGHVETRRVTVGLAFKDQVQITDGVDQGDVVISLAGGFLREGDRVRPVPQDTPPKT